MMKTMIENGSLTLCLEGCIDSNNAPAAEDEIFAAVNANPGATVTLDAVECDRQGTQFRKDCFC